MMFTFCIVVDFMGLQRSPAVFAANAAQWKMQNIFLCVLQYSSGLSSCQQIPFMVWSRFIVKKTKLKISMILAWLLTSLC